MNIYKTLLKFRCDPLRPPLFTPLYVQLYGRWYHWSPKATYIIDTRDLHPNLFYFNIVFTYIDLNLYRKYT